jgi:hypothetical protein
MESRLGIMLVAGCARGSAAHPALYGSDCVGLSADKDSDMVLSLRFLGGEYGEAMLVERDGAGIFGRDRSG